MYNENFSVCANDKRIYDKAPVNFHALQIQGQISGSLPMGAMLIDVCPICDMAAPFQITLEQVPMRPLIKRASGYIKLPARIRYRVNTGTAQADANLFIPVDALIRVPECADHELGAIVTGFCVTASEISAGDSLLITADICAALCVLVETPRCAPPHCHMPPPMPIYPTCPPYEPDICRPQMPQKPCRPFPPPCPPPREVCRPLPPPCPPAPPICPPIPCAPPRRPCPPMGGCRW